MVSRGARVRWRLCLMVALLIGLGLPSRLGIPGAPSGYVLYAGDALWAAMVYFGYLFLWPAWPRGRAIAVALTSAYLIECSQLAHPEWLDQLRATFPVGLVLGHDFVWTDLVAYTVGIVLAALLDGAWLRKKRNPDPQASG